MADDEDESNTADDTGTDVSDVESTDSAPPMQSTQEDIAKRGNRSGSMVIKHRTNSSLGNHLDLVNRMVSRWGSVDMDKKEVEDAGLHTDSDYESDGNGNGNKNKKSKENKEQQPPPSHRRVISATDELKVLEAEKAALDFAFDNYIDPDLNGDVDIEEWLIGLQKLDVSLTDPQCKQIYKMMDKEDSGFIEKSDFVNFLTTKFQNEQLLFLQRPILDAVRVQSLHDRTHSNLMNPINPSIDWNTNEMDLLHQEMEQAMTGMVDHMKQVLTEEQKFENEMNKRIEADSDLMEPENALKWTKYEVTYWLQCMGMERYSRYFAQESVDGQMLFEDMTEDLVMNLGVRQLHAKKIMREITALKKSVRGVSDKLLDISPFICTHEVLDYAKKIEYVKELENAKKAKKSLKEFYEKELKGKDQLILELQKEIQAGIDNINSKKKKKKGKKNDKISKEHQRKKSAALLDKISKSVESTRNLMLTVEKSMDSDDNDDGGYGFGFDSTPNATKESSKSMSVISEDKEQNDSNNNKDETKEDTDDNEDGDGDAMDANDGENKDDVDDESKQELDDGAIGDIVSDGGEDAKEKEKEKDSDGSDGSDDDDDEGSDDSDDSDDEDDDRRKLFGMKQSYLSQIHNSKKGPSPKQIQRFVKDLKKKHVSDVNNFCIEDCDTIMNWTASEVAYWMVSQNFSQYAFGFYSTPVDGDMLIRDLSAEILTEDLGVKKIHIRRILRCVLNLRRIIDEGFDIEVIDGCNIDADLERPSMEQIESLQDRIETLEEERNRIMQELESKGDDDGDLEEGYFTVKINELEAQKEEMKVGNDALEQKISELQTEFELEAENLNNVINQEKNANDDLKKELKKTKKKLRKAKRGDVDDDDDDGYDDLDDDDDLEEEKKEDVISYVEVNCTDEDVSAQIEKEMNENNDFCVKEKTLEWSPAEVCHWLSDIQFDKYRTVFYSAQIFGDVLLQDIGSRMLKKFRVTDMHRPKLLRQIGNLRKQIQNYGIRIELSKEIENEMNGIDDSPKKKKKKHKKDKKNKKEKGGNSDGKVLELEAQLNDKEQRIEGLIEQMDEEKQLRIGFELETEQLRKDNEDLVRSGSKQQIEHLQDTISQIEESKIRTVRYLNEQLHSFRTACRLQQREIDFIKENANVGGFGSFFSAFGSNNTPL